MTNAAAGIPPSDDAPVYAHASPPQGLVGRDAEIERLRSLVDAVSEAGSALVVLGDPGGGKSALLDVAKEPSGTLMANVEWAQPAVATRRFVLLGGPSRLGAPPHACPMTWPLGRAGGIRTRDLLTPSQAR
jgi:hypothetical protein